MVVKIYVSGISGNKEVKKKQQRVQMILDSKSISYEAIDITEPGREKDKETMQSKAKTREALGKHPLPPQLFNEEEYCGDYEDFDMANEVDGLEAFLHLPLPSKLSSDNNSTSPEKINGSREDGSIQNGDQSTEIRNGDVELTPLADDGPGDQDEEEVTGVTEGESTAEPEEGANVNSELPEESEVPNEQEVPAESPSDPQPEEPQTEEETEALPEAQEEADNGAEVSATNVETSVPQDAATAEDETEGADESNGKIEISVEEENGRVEAEPEALSKADESNEKIEISVEEENGRVEIEPEALSKADERNVLVPEVLDVNENIVVEEQCEKIAQSSDSLELSTDLNPVRGKQVDDRELRSATEGESSIPETIVTSRKDSKLELLAEASAEKAISKQEERAEEKSALTIREEGNKCSDNSLVEEVDSESRELDKKNSEEEIKENTVSVEERQELVQESVLNHLGHQHILVLSEGKTYSDLSKVNSVIQDPEKPITTTTITNIEGENRVTPSSVNIVTEESSITVERVIEQNRVVVASEVVSEDIQPVRVEVEENKESEEAATIVHNLVVTESDLVSGDIELVVAEVVENKDSEANSNHIKLQTIESAVNVGGVQKNTPEEIRITEQPDPPKEQEVIGNLIATEGEKAATESQTTVSELVVSGEKSRSLADGSGVAPSEKNIETPATREQEQKEISLADTAKEIEAKQPNTSSELIDSSGTEKQKVDLKKKKLPGSEDSAEELDEVRPLKRRDTLKQIKRPSLPLVKSAPLEEIVSTEIINDSNMPSRIGGLAIKDNAPEEVKEPEQDATKEGVPTRDIMVDMYTPHNIDKISFSPQLVAHHQNQKPPPREERGVPLRSWNRRPSEVDVVKEVRNLLDERDTDLAICRARARAGVHQLRNPHKRFLEQMSKLVSDIEAVEEIVDYQVVHPLPPPRAPTPPPPIDPFIQEVLNALNAPWPRVKPSEDNGFLKQVKELVNTEQLTQTVFFTKERGPVPESDFVEKVRVILDEKEQSLGIIPEPRAPDHSEFLGDVLLLLNDEPIVTDQEKSQVEIIAEQPRVVPKMPAPVEEKKQPKTKDIVVAQIYIRDNVFPVVARVTSDDYKIFVSSLGSRKIELSREDVEAVTITVVEGNGYKSDVAKIVVSPQ